MKRMCNKFAALSVFIVTIMLLTGCISDGEHSGSISSVGSCQAAKGYDKVFYSVTSENIKKKLNDMNIRLRAVLGGHSDVVVKFNNYTYDYSDLNAAEAKIKADTELKKMAEELMLEEGDVYIDGIKKETTKPQVIAVVFPEFNYTIVLAGSK